MGKPRTRPQPQPKEAAGGTPARKKAVLERGSPKQTPQLAANGKAQKVQGEERPSPLSVLLNELGASSSRLPSIANLPCALADVDSVISRAIRPPDPKVFTAKRGRDSSARACRGPVPAGSVSARRRAEPPDGAAVPGGAHGPEVGVPFVELEPALGDLLPVAGRAAMLSNAPNEVGMGMSRSAAASSAIAQEGEWKQVPTRTNSGEPQSARPGRCRRLNNSPRTTPTRGSLRLFEG